MIPGAARLSMGRCAIQPPAVGDAPQLVLATVLEREAGAGDEILDRLGDEDLACIGIRCDPCTNRDGQPCRLALDQLAFPGMDAGTDFEPQLVPQTLADLERAADRPRRPVEGRIEAVAGGVVLDPPPSLQRIPNDRVVTLDEALPRRGRRARPASGSSRPDR